MSGIMRIDDLTWVAGGRNFDNHQEMAFALDHLPPEGWLITGAAKGADLMAENFRRNSQRPYIGVPARWRELGKRAGYVRNLQIAEYNPNRLIVLPGGRGTKMALDLAKDLDIEIIYA